MHVAQGKVDFNPAVLTITTLPISCKMSCDVAVIHTNYTCLEPTFTGETGKYLWPAVVFQDDMGVSIIRSLLTTDAVLVDYVTQTNMWDA
jgi:hypothetical protein